MRRLLAVGLLAVGLLAGRVPPAGAATPWDDTRVVPRAQLVAALREQAALGYRLDAIANSVRLQTGVFLRLAADEEARGQPPRAMRLRHQDWFAAYLEVTGLQAQAVPAWVQAPHLAGEDYLVDGRPDVILDLATTKTPPRRAVVVKAGWPMAPGAPASYSFEDRSTDPSIETTRQQVNGYRVLDYGDAIVVDGIYGVTGRATSGLLGAIFSLIGHARAEQSRFGLAADGAQISRTTARKGLSLTQAIAILPDGTVIPSVPDTRADWLAVDARLAALPLAVVWRPVDRSPLPPAPPDPAAAPAPPASPGS
jgi:hypothetical protein